jgi:Zn-dependent peptidase ImmA (M78 family)/plasmid maintenance system antidote protein VapI
MADAAFQPDWFSKPGDTLCALMVRRKLSPATLAERMGRDVALVHGLLAGAVDIDTRIAVLLANSIGGSPSFWKTRQTQFDKSLDRAARALPADRVRSWLRTLPLKEMAKAGWIAASQEPGDDVKSSLSYFDVTDPDEWRERYAAFENVFSFRSSPSFESKVGALSAWLRQGEIHAAVIPCAAWDADLFRARLVDVRVLTKAKSPAYFIPKLRAICAEAGVAVVFVRVPSGCRASGATRFLADAKAMIILSFRYMSDDHFWFTFFHEAGHLLLHSNKSTFVDGESADQTDKELEANTFSASVLIPRSRQDALMDLRPRSLDVIRFALSIGVSPGIVVGQMQHLGVISLRQLNRLKRRYTWEQILCAVG